MLLLIKPSDWQRDALPKLIIGKRWLKASVCTSLANLIDKNSTVMFVLGTCPIGHAPQTHKACKHHEISSSGHTNKFSTSQAIPSLRPASWAKLQGQVSP
jgi:hypothetical protein